MGRAFGIVGVRKSVYRILAKKYKGKRPLGSYRRRKENEVKLDFQKIGWERGLD